MALSFLAAPSKASLIEKLISFVSRHSRFSLEDGERCSSRVKVS